ncbi:rab-GTPase-TBC domain-containing protein [Obelidium mucronatum]|nr:rab-GTPase-TBC domain-containing protein [Obelidium mucronatum]
MNRNGTCMVFCKINQKAEQMASWLMNETPKSPVSPIKVANAPPRVSSLRPATSSTKLQLLNQLEQMNHQLRNDPQAVTSTLSACNTAPFNTQDPIDLQISFYLSVVENLQDDKHYLQKIDALFRSKVRNGIPDAVRSKVWKAMALADGPAAMSEERFAELLECDARGTFDKIIRQDIHRTFPEHAIFAEPGGEGQTKLYNVLKAYAVYDSDCGYCQGMSFLVAPLLLLEDISELDAFRIFARLMDESVSSSGKRFALRSMFTPEMPGLHLLLHQHSELVRAFLPGLHEKLSFLNITASTYASPWFLTLFTLLLSYFPHCAVIVLLKISLALLRRNELGLMGAREDDFETCLELLKGDRVLAAFGEDCANQLMQDVFLLDSVVTEPVLTKLSASYFEQKQIATISSLEIQTLRAKVDFMGIQLDSIYKENTALKIALSQANQQRIVDVGETRKLLEDKLGNALAMAELERRKREELEKQVQLLNEQLARMSSHGEDARGPRRKGLQRH